MGWESGLQETMIRYFTYLFKASKTHWDEMIDCMESKITSEQNSELLQPITDTKLKKALFHMQPYKSAGSNGMSLGFYQRYWNVMGDDIVKMTRNFFESGVFEEHIKVLT